MISTCKKALVVAAHPDDEILGCGGTIHRLSSSGAEVDILILADGESSRKEENPDSRMSAREKQAAKAAAILGANKPQLLNLADQRLDTYPLLEIIQSVEDIVERIKPDVVLTHHEHDLNADHRICHQAVVTACRPLPGSTFRGIYAFEIPSSTDFAFGKGGEGFQPSCFVDITQNFSAKIEALKCYEQEMRPAPHPRSYNSIDCLARLRGSGVGIPYAEAFVPVWEKF